MSNQYDLYRCTNSDGTTKDWAVQSNTDGTYTSRWGKTGTKLQSKTFKNRLSKSAHIREKLNKGYRYMGIVMIDDSGHVQNMSSGISQPVASVDTHPTEDNLCIYWRVKIHMSVNDSIYVPFLNGLAAGYANTIHRFIPDCPWVEKIANGHDNFVKTHAGSLLKETGVASLLLLMALKKNAPEGITVSLSHEDAVEISDNIKLESEALSLFGTNLESVRQISEDIGLLVKRLDLSMIAPENEDFYF